MNMDNIKRKLEILANAIEYNPKGTTEHYLKFIPSSKEPCRECERVDTFKSTCKWNPKGLNIKAVCCIYM